MLRAALLRRSGQFALSRGRTDCRMELNRVAGADNDPIVGNNVMQRPSARRTWANPCSSVSAATVR